MKTGKILVECEDTKVLFIPEGITHIDDNACDCFEQLEELVLPDSLKKIGREAFAGCENLKKIHFGNGVEEIGECAFDACESLSEIDLPGCINWIDEYAFASCRSLSRVHISNGSDSEGCGYIYNICERAFAHCKALTYVDIEKRVEDWGDEVFANTGLREFVCPDMIEREREQFHTGVYLSERMFENCSKLKRIVLPRNLECIGEDAFKDCTKLKEIVKKDDDWEEMGEAQLREFMNERVATGRKNEQ